MPRIRLDVDDLPLRLTLKVMLESDGHALAEAGTPADVVIADDPQRATAAVGQAAVLLLTPQSALNDAVQAMRKGVFGYVAVPLVPGEAPLMVQRALGAASAVGDDDASDLVRLEDVERAHIERVLRRCKHNQAEAARVLGIGRNTLWRKLKQYSAAASAGLHGVPLMLL